MKKSKVFEETYNNYLDEISQLDLKKRAKILGAQIDRNDLIISFFNNSFRVTESGIFGLEEKNPSFAVKIVLCKYVLMCPKVEIPLQSSLVTYREFKDAGPLTSYFTNNTNKTIETSFSGKLKLLRQKCLAAGGSEKKMSSYELSVEFFALPNIPILLNFNDMDDLFPAGCSILYRASAEKFLDMECLAITGTYLTGLLI